MFIAAAIATLAWAGAAGAQPPPRPTGADLQRLAGARTQALHDADECEALRPPTQSAPACDAFFRAVADYAGLLTPVMDWCEYLVGRISAHDPSVRLDAYCLTLNHDPVVERQDRIAARVGGQ